MKKLVLFTTIILMLSTRGNAQYFIAGNIQNDKSEPVAYASIVLAHTKTSVSSDSLGNFIILSTEYEGLLTVSAVGYETTIEKVRRQGDTTYISIKMQPLRKVLETVTITAGTINTNDSGGSKLSTADILETAGANADIAKALQTLPGFQKNGLETGLMVRGGDVSETAIVIDNSIVQNPFFSAIPGVSQNSRFGAFQFKGISYSSGGYSARYDQALSSILELNTLDLPTTDNINLGINFSGIYASASKKWKKSGFTISSHYTNLKYFYNWAKTNINFYKAPEGPSLALNYSWRTTRGGMLKFTTNNILSSSGSRIPDPFNYGSRINYALKNMNTFSNLSFKQAFNKLSLFTSVAFSYNKDDINWNDQPGDNINKRLQARVEAKYYLIRDFSLLTGFEVQHFNINRLQLGVRQFYSEDQLGGYIEGLYSYGKWLSVRPGLRFSSSRISSDTKPSPRLAVNLILNSGHQISFSGGTFYQNQEDIYLLSGYRGKMQRAIHYIANYQYQTEKKTFRAEVYYKDYDGLFKEHTTTYNPNIYRTISTHVTTSGYGYAKGIDLFWRDKSSIKNLDYWISYSLIDTKRDYRNLQKYTTPEFVARHNLNVVGKYYFERLHSGLSATYSFASGKPYFNPADPEFLGQNTPHFHTLAVHANHHLRMKKWFAVIYMGIDNVMNRENIFGYNYSSDLKQRYAVTPALYRNFFAGVNFSLSGFGKHEL